MVRKKDLIANILNIDVAKSVGKGYDLSVTLKKNYKGTSLYATKPIKRGKVIAYYKVMVYKYKNFRSYQKFMYTISVYTKNGNISNSLIADIYPGSLEPPKYNIPFWAYFSNEPSKQRENCTLDINTKYNYKNRSKLKPGDTMVYKLVATKDISPGEEICWCYGEDYDRNYKSDCA